MEREMVFQFAMHCCDILSQAGFILCISCNASEFAAYQKWILLHQHNPEEFYL